MFEIIEQFKEDTHIITHSHPYTIEDIYFIIGYQKCLFSIIKGIKKENQMVLHQIKHPNTQLHPTPQELTILKKHYDLNKKFISELDFLESELNHFLADKHWTIFISK